MESPWPRFDVAVDVTATYERKLAALAVYEAVFGGDHSELPERYGAEDRYVGSLLGVRYAEAFNFKAQPATGGRAGSHGESPTVGKAPADAAAEGLPGNSPDLGRFRQALVSPSDDERVRLFQWRVRIRHGLHPVGQHVMDGHHRDCMAPG